MMPHTTAVPPSSQNKDELPVTGSGPPGVVVLAWVAPGEVDVVGVGVMGGPPKVLGT
jgi:hypothetical protein